MVDMAVGDCINLERKVASWERMSAIAGLDRSEKISRREELWGVGF